MNVVFGPMFFVGLAGISRRLWDQTQYTMGEQTHEWVVASSWGAWMLGVAQLPFIINFFWSAFAGRKTNDNPWEATTLEWAAPSPPPHGNFAVTPTVYRGPYEYTVPGAKTDFSPQHLEEA